MGKYLLDGLISFLKKIHVKDNNNSYFRQSAFERDAQQDFPIIFVFTKEHEHNFMFKELTSSARCAETDF